MATVSQTQTRRSISMPAKPKQHQESKRLKRTRERETIIQTESTNWDSGSNIDLSTEHLDDSEPLVLRKRPLRIVEKNGRENVKIRSVPDKYRFIKDLMTTLIELKWLYMLAMFLSSYFISWFIFAVLYYMVSYSHGDLTFDIETGQRMNEGQQPCIIGVYDFLSMLVYSVEVQTTNGFGDKYPTEQCPDMIILYMLQLIFSMVFEGGLVCIIYAKTARPAKQVTKLKFSNKAVICYRDGQLCLLFRVCDPREQQTIESKIRVFLIQDKKTLECERIKMQMELKLENDGQPIIAWPELICHVIDKNSPLYQYKTAKEFNKAQFELYVCIVGTSASTTQVTEARTSYIPQDIFWGQRFINIINYDAFNGQYVVDYGNFNTTISVDMTSSKVESIKEQRNLSCRNRNNSRKT